MWSFFQHASLSRRRVSFEMPLKWPVTAPALRCGGPEAAHTGPAGAKAWLSEALTAMLSCRTGFDLILALMSDAYWYDANAREAFKPAVDAAVAAAVASGEGDEPLPPLFYAATIVAKQIVRHLYDLTTGALMRSRVASALNLARALAGLDPKADVAAAAAVELPDNDFEHYAGSSADADGPESGPTIDVWQALKCLVAIGAANAIFDVKWGPALEALAACDAAETAQATNGPTAAGPARAFSDTLAYQTDLLSHLLRSVMAVTGAVQQLSTHLLQFFDRQDALNRPTKMPAGGLQRERGTDWDSVWRRYYFDLAAMWTMARVFHEALLTGDPRALVHAASNARTWTLAGALVDSVPLLERTLRKKATETARGSAVVPNGRSGGPKGRSSGLTGPSGAPTGSMASALAMLPDILHAGATLHGLYLRVWDAVMVFCNTKRYGRGNIERAMARAAAAVLVTSPSSVSVRQEMPDCGASPTDPLAAVILDNWPLSLVGPDQAGLVDTEGTALLGSSLEDLKCAACSAHASRPVAQSVQHLWVCVTNPQAWVSLGDTLPQMDDICTKLLIWRPDWSPTAEDLAAMGARYKQQAIAKQAKEQALELSELMKAF